MLSRLMLGKDLPRVVAGVSTQVTADVVSKSL